MNSTFSKSVPTPFNQLGSVSHTAVATSYLQYLRKYFAKLKIVPEYLYVCTCALGPLGEAF